MKKMLIMLFGLIASMSLMTSETDKGDGIVVAVDNTEFVNEEIEENEFVFNEGIVNPIEVKDAFTSMNIVNTDKEYVIERETTIVDMREKALKEKLEKEEAERKAKAEAEKKAKEEAERKAKEEAEKKAREEKKKKEQNKKQKEQKTENKQKEEKTEVKRAETVNVSGVKVTITSSVSDDNYYKFISWVENMPTYLICNITAIEVVDDMGRSDDTWGDLTLAGYVRGESTLVINAKNLHNKKGTLYHEAAHVFDRKKGHSATETWMSIANAEWAGEGYYASSYDESFAEAISRYHLNELVGMPKTKEAIENMLNTGKLAKESEYTDLDMTVNVSNRALWIYAGASDNTTWLGIIGVGENVKITGINKSGTWYRVEYNGQVAYTEAEFVDYNIEQQQKAAEKAALEEAEAAARAEANQ